MGVNGVESTPPPVIGKIGPYTVFMTPPSTPKPSSSLSPPPPPSSASTKILPPPLHPPPTHIHNPVSPHKSSSVFGFFKNAVTKVQAAHSSLDDHLARWFGLDHSKYQWALNDYYESEGMEKGDIRVKEVSSKAQSV
ncbi:hypothetical protein Lal_00049882 [Lupinus albus]|uniref:Uncharacterized protein n=1 Tax=Lupinus albus TaxID=3870 RepID=A0A6A5M5T5_LUPAL|nr:hypothetical protein Lalb_Chr12g0199461 [Lupinus albus]KAF1867453.1 hypothetical protein Lal_00049882 [Lupinus albus]